MQKVFKDNTMRVMYIKECFNLFKNGQISTESEPCSERPSMNHNKQIIGQICDMSIADIV